MSQLAQGCPGIYNEKSRSRHLTLKSRLFPPCVAKSCKLEARGNWYLWASSQREERRLSLSSLSPFDLVCVRSGTLSPIRAAAESCVERQDYANMMG